MSLVECGFEGVVLIGEYDTEGVLEKGEMLGPECLYGEAGTPEGVCRGM